VLASAAAWLCLEPASPGHRAGVPGHDYPINVDTPDWDERGAAAIAAEQRHVEDLLANSPLNPKQTRERT
jgi:hypothetical protein